MPHADGLSTQPQTSLNVSEIIDRIASLDADERSVELARLRAQDPRLARALETALSAEWEVGSAVEAGPSEADPIAALIGRAASLAAKDAYDPPMLDDLGIRVLSLIGEGGSGTVYRAEQENPRRDVAVKVLPRDPDRPQREVFEAAVASRLSHPNAVTILRSGAGRTRSGSPVTFIVTELIDGEQLVSYVSRRDLDFSTRARLLAELAEVIAFAHDRGVVHGDLKPANVLIDDSARPRILDFGVSSVREHGLRHDGRESGARAMTARYTTPARRDALTPPSERDDLYAIGVLTADVFVGHGCGFEPGDGAEVWIGRLGGCRCTRAQRAALAQIIARSLRDSEESYRSASSVSDDLLALADDDLAALGFSTPKLMTWRLLRRARRWALPVSLVCILASVVAIGLADRSKLLAERERLATSERNLVADIGLVTAALEESALELGRSRRGAALATRTAVLWARAIAEGDLARAGALVEGVREQWGGLESGAWGELVAAEILFDTGGYARASGVLSELLSSADALGPHELEAALRLDAEVALMLHKPARAVASASRLLAETERSNRPADDLVQTSSLLARAYSADARPLSGLQTLEHRAGRTNMHELSPRSRRAYLVALASCQLAGGNTSDARDSLERALAEVSPIETRDPREELEVLSRHALVLAELGQPRRARATLDHVVQRFEDVMGTIHPRTVEARYQLARAELRLGEIESGIERLRACLDALQSEEQIELHAAILDALADAYEITGRHTLAHETLVELRSVRAEIKGTSESEWVIMAEFRGVRARFAIDNDWPRSQPALLGELRSLLSRAVAAGGASSEVARLIYQELSYRIEQARNAGADLQGMENFFAPIDTGGQ